MYLIKFQKSLEVIMLTKQFLKFKYRCQSEGKQSLTVEFKWKTVMVIDVCSLLWGDYFQNILLA